MLITASPMETITSSLTSGFTSIVGDMMSSIGEILPIVLPVVGAVAVIFLGVKLFKKLAK